MADPDARQFRLLEKRNLEHQTIQHDFVEWLPTRATVEAPVSTPLAFIHMGGTFNVHLVEVASADGSVIRESPAYFAVAYQKGITDIRTVVLFAHPAPTHGYNDAQYIGQNGQWNAILRYAKYFGNQLSAARKDLVFIMPIFSQVTFGSLGIFPLEWKALLTGVLTRVQSEIWPDRNGQATPRNPQTPDKIILACYSLGRQLARSMLGAPGLQDQVVEVWDFDGVPGGPAPIRLPGKATYYYNQAVAGPGFHVPLQRWSKFDNYSGLVQTEAANRAKPHWPGVIHGEIVMRLAYHAAGKSSYGGGFG